MPARLTSVKLLGDLIAAVGGNAANSISPHITALASGVSRAMFMAKAKIVTGLLLAVAVFATGGTLARQAIGSRPSEVAAQEKSARSMVGRPKDKDKPAFANDTDKQASVTYDGHVLDPEGKPVAGEGLLPLPFPGRRATPRQGHDGVSGRFSFTLNRNQVPESAQDANRDPLTSGKVIVKANGFAYAWASSRIKPGTKPPADQVFRLSRDDIIVEGRILDLEGKPVSGLRISVLSVAAFNKADLADFIKALGAQASLFETFRFVSDYLMNPLTGSTMAKFLPGATTGRDGRFRLHGFAKEQLLELGIEGESVENQTVYVMTRPRPPGSPQILTPLRMKHPVLADNERVFVLWNGFDHAMPPGQTVVGTVLDDKTGKPIPRALVESYQLAGSTRGENSIYRTVADNLGRYRFTGLPRGKGNKIRFRPPTDLPFLPVVKEVLPTEALAQATVDVRLERGVWAEVTTKDKSSDKPVSGCVSYFLLPEDWSKNPTLPLPATRLTNVYNDFLRIRPNGTFRFVAVPGRAIVAFRPDFKNYPIPAEASTLRLPSVLAAVNFAAFVEINPTPDESFVKVDFVVDAGHKVQGKLFDPEGRPVTGALVTGLRSDQVLAPDYPPLHGADFTIVGLQLNRPRLICFVHLDKKLAGSLVVRGDESSRQVVKLMPWGTVSGRLLDEQGKPIKNSNLEFTDNADRKPGQPMSLDLGAYIVEPIPGQLEKLPRTDENGRFSIDRLIPGLKYDLALTGRDRRNKEGIAFTNLVLKPGESKDLGDVTLQPFSRK